MGIIEIKTRTLSGALYIWFYADKILTVAFLCFQIYIDVHCTVQYMYVINIGPELETFLYS